MRFSSHHLAQIYFYLLSEMDPSWCLSMVRFYHFSVKMKNLQYGMGSRFSLLKLFPTISQNRKYKDEKEILL